MFRFRTDIVKKIQAAAVLLRLEKNRMDRIRLLKLLYIADREALRKTGRPIIGGRVVAMDSGPLHSEVYDLIKGSHEDERQWSDFFENEGHVVVLRQDAGRENLSPYEIEKLTEVWNRYAADDSWALADLTHTFPEYIGCFQEGTSRTIPLERILEALGFSIDEIEKLREDAEAHKHFKNAFDD